MSSLSLVILLCALACPLTMGLMMWFMGKGMRSHRGSRDSDETTKPNER